MDRITFGWWFGETFFSCGCPGFGIDGEQRRRGEVGGRLRISDRKANLILLLVAL
jgi:hypothetical protein